MSVTKLIYNCETGKYTRVELTEEELLAIPLEVNTWHKELKNARVCFPVEVYNANLQKLLAHNLGLENHPFLAALVVAVQNGEFIRVDADGMVYYYCDEVYESDKHIINSYGGIIEYKP